MIHKANVNIGGEHSETFEMITMLPGDKVKMQYADTPHNIFTIEGYGIKFNGQMNNGVRCLLEIGIYNQKMVIGKSLLHLN